MSDEHAYLNKMNITADKNDDDDDDDDNEKKNNKYEWEDVHSFLYLNFTALRYSTAPFPSLQSKPSHEPLTIHYPFKSSTNLLSEQPKTCSPFQWVRMQKHFWKYR